VTDIVLPAILFTLFTVLAVLGLFLLLRHHYGAKTAALWSVLLLLAFAALGWWVYAIVEGSGLA
jgi:hypothetical protein